MALRIRQHLGLGAAFAFALGLAMFVSSCGTKGPELIPRTVLFGNPEKVAPKISPDGEKLAYVAPLDGVLNVWVKTIGTDDDRAVTSDEGRGIFRYSWAEDSGHIMYLKDADGDENWLLYTVDLATGDVRNLTPYEDVQVRIVDRSKRLPGIVLISMNKRDARLHDVYRLDVASAGLTMVAENPGDIAEWVADYDLKVRGALVSTPDGGTDLLIRKSEGSKWRKKVSWGPDDALASYPLGFSKDGNHIYLVDSRGANAGRLVEMGIDSGETEVLAEDQQYDIDNVMINPDTYEVEAVSFVRARTEWLVLDPSVKEDFEAIRELDHGDFAVYDRDNADDTWLVGFVKDNGPVSYYSFDRNGTTGTFLFDHHSELNDYTLASMEPISLTARDGLAIHGYITYPPGAVRSNLPVVLVVHGGPWARDYWGYNSLAQWLANRGYACLQVNFRGSTGYGKEFLNAGDREWGGKAHDDLIDAVNWAVHQGIADPERIAIFGGSYGGYAALVGATFTPDVFSCAVAFAAPSNLVTFIETVPPYWTTMLSLIHERFGHPEKDKEFLESRSPLFKVDQIKIPMLISQGANDPRVKQAEAEQIVEAMKKNGIECEYLLFPDEGHGLARPENRLMFFAAAEEFLATHLGGRFEAAGGE